MEQTKDAHSLARQTLECIGEANDANAKTLKDLNAATQSAETLDDHHRQQEESWQKHSQRLTNIVKNNEGVWISTKRF